MVQSLIIVFIVGTRQKEDRKMILNTSQLHYKVGPYITYGMRQGHCVALPNLLPCI
jgi:hypothetical protein